MQDDPSATETRWTMLTQLKNLDNEECWREFDRRYRGLIVKIALGAGLRPHEANDVAQETLMAVAKNIGTFTTDPKRGSFRSWLLNMTRWRITDQFRKRLPVVSADTPGELESSRTPLLERFPDEHAVDLQSACDANWAEWLLQQATEGLRLEVQAEHYQIFHLLTVQKKTVQEASKIVGRSPAQIYLIRHRLNKVLKKLLARLNQELE